MRKSTLSKIALRAGISMAVTAGVLWTPGIGCGQETTATASATAKTTASATAESTQTIVLLGEKVSLDSDNPKKGPFPDLAGLASSLVGGKVDDLTSVGSSIAATAKVSDSASVDKPDVAIIFTGYTDEKQEVSDDDQRAALKKLAQNLRAKNKAVRIFLVPATTSIGAITNANLRLASGDLNATYVTLGTEVSGEPYKLAFESVKSELAGPAVETADAPPPPKQIYVSKGGIAAPPAGGQTQQELKTSLQTELQRIAGEVDGAPIVSAEDNLTTANIYAELSTTDPASMKYPPGGTLTKHGAEAQQEINMRPLPAVKAFRPVIPVPRNDLDVKEPAFSR